MLHDEDGNITSQKPDPSKKRTIKVEDIVLGVPPRLDDEKGGARTGPGSVVHL
jgi:hypothetical protein